MSKYKKQTDTFISSIKQMHEAHLMAIQALVNNLTRKQLEKLQSICEGRSVELLSGMGTWIISINGLDILNLDMVSKSEALMLDSDSEERYFNLEARELCFELNNALTEIASEYNVYPDDLKLKAKR